MAMTPDEVARFVDAAARALALPIAPEHRTGVIGYFALAASLAEIVDAQAVDLHEEPAAVFVPVSPVDPLDGSR